ncbi:MAG: hypothetical protein KKB51_21960 [Candidatus Riflebacteria bacterium]|nr:hypothetical protein [Candidatus Riflebacteria bacterium]
MPNLSKCIIISGLIFVLALTQISWAQNPGTVSDPLVSKSYIDHFLKFRSIVLPADSLVNPEPGAMIIVRSGQLRLEAPKGKTLIDLTAGKEISSGVDLPLNHLIIVPDSAEYVLKARNMTMLLASCLLEEKAH